MQQIAFRRLMLAAGGFLAFATAGMAAQPLALERATNIPGVTTSAAPPAHFDAVSATDEDLSAYGFPPRPNATQEPAAYARWAAAVGSQPERLVPELLKTAVYHGPHIPTGAKTIANAATSSNWSGYTADTGAASWSSSSFSTVAADFIVPAVSAQSCNGTWEYSSAWAGIDGYASSDVLQAGVEADAMCAQGLTQTYYSPWYEWYPNASTRITNLTAAAGQTFYVHVWATTATAGHAYVENLNTNQSVSINFSAPSGTKLRGESAEWVVESPSVNGSLATLPTYGLDYFAGATSKTLAGTPHLPGTAGSIAISLVRSGTTYSTSALLGNGGIEFTSR